VVEIRGETIGVGSESEKGSFSQKLRPMEDQERRKKGLGSSRVSDPLRVPNKVFKIVGRNLDEEDCSPRNNFGSPELMSRTRKKKKKPRKRIVECSLKKKRKFCLSSRQFFFAAFQVRFCFISFLLAPLVEASQFGVSPAKGCSSST
jgi:hypothetical protein